MFKQSVALTLVILVIVVFGCAIGSKKTGTGGTGSAKKIERTGHPDTPDGVSCFVCHKEDIPEHEYHKKYGNKCDECHERDTWAANKYFHPAWFLDVNHKTRCSRCHSRAVEHNFIFYQCYGCHHEQEAIKGIHANLESKEISNCIECHKSTPDK